MGRKIHIKPAQKKPPKQEGSGVEEKSSFKNKKKTWHQENFDNETNWNYLFINHNVAASSFAREEGVSKGDLLSWDADNLASRVGLIETNLIGKVKSWMLEEGFDISELEGKADRLNTRRSETVLFAKNF